MTGGPSTSRLSRPTRLTLACLAAVAVVGLVATVDGFARAGGFPRLSASLLAVTPLVVAATLANLLVRFVRWQFLLRRLGLRLPTIPALGAFVASFAFLPVPFYVGQLAARIRLLAVEPACVRRVVLAFGCEQALNVWALTLLAAPGVPWARATALALTAVGIAAAVLRRLVGHDTRSGAAGRDGLGGGALVVAAALSLLAWVPVVATVPALLWAVGASIDPVAGMAAAARATLLGAMSFVPLGASVSGMALFEALPRLGAPLAAAAETVLVHRAATTWLSVALGGAALLALRRTRVAPHVHDHFDAIDACYDAWLPAHYRDHLVGRKTTPIVARLAALGPKPRALDIGCGRGWYATRMRAAGAAVTGMDASTRQLVAAREYLGGDVPLVQGDALRLPFAAGVFDFTYIINVLHHVATPDAQRDAIAEIGRVVRPGGLVFVHEMSVRNPLFRLYLGYVYPITKGIEEGTEHYLDPRRMGDVPGLRLVEVRYFTFVPDFAPRALLPWLARLERRLEASPLAPWAAHFLVVYERTAASGATAQAP